MSNYKVRSSEDGKNIELIHEGQEKPLIMAPREFAKYADELKVYADAIRGDNSFEYKGGNLVTFKDPIIYADKLINRFGEKIGGIATFSIDDFGACDYFYEKKGLNFPVHNIVISNDRKEIKKLSGRSIGMEDWERSRYDREAFKTKKNLIDIIYPVVCTLFVDTLIFAMLQHKEFSPDKKYPIFFRGFDKMGDDMFEKIMVFFDDKFNYFWQRNEELMCLYQTNRQDRANFVMGELPTGKFQHEYLDTGVLKDLIEKKMIKND